MKNQETNRLTARSSTKLEPDITAIQTRIVVDDYGNELGEAHTEYMRKIDAFHASFRTHEEDAA